MNNINVLDYLLILVVGVFYLRVLNFQCTQNNLLFQLKNIFFIILIDFQLEVNHFKSINNVFLCLLSVTFFFVYSILIMIIKKIKLFFNFMIHDYL